MSIQKKIERSASIRYRIVTKHQGKWATIASNLNSEEAENALRQYREYFGNEFRIEPEG